MPSPIEIFDRLEKYLSTAIRENSIALSLSTTDGRVNSQKDEKEISKALRLFTHSNEWFTENNLKLDVAMARHWYDFAISDNNGLFLPVNIKVSKLTTGDNISSKGGVFYALTGVLPEKVNSGINTWERFCENLASRLDPYSAADYYFMVISKKSEDKVFWTSLKNISSLISNGNNPPFQCRWSANRERSNRPAEDAHKYILRVLRETFRLRAEALKSFDLHLKDFT